MATKFIFKKKPEHYLNEIIAILLMGWSYFCFFYNQYFLGILLNVLYTYSLKCFM